MSSNSSTRPTATSAGNGNAAGYDERFVVPLEASRRGAHRARVSPLMAMLPIVAVVGIVVGAIGLVWVFLGGMSGSSSDPTTAGSPTPTATASGSASQGAQESPAAGNSSEPTDGATAGAGAGDVDKTITVAVFNGTRTPKLAQKAGSKLTAAGWKLGEVASWTGTPVTSTTVYYGTADQKASAQAVAKALGRGVIKLSASKAGAGLTVVVAGDFSGGKATSTRSTGSSRSAGNTRTTEPSASPSPPADSSPTDSASPQN